MHDTINKLFWSFSSNDAYSVRTWYHLKKNSMARLQEKPVHNSISPVEIKHATQTQELMVESQP